METINLVNNGSDSEPLQQNPDAINEQVATSEIEKKKNKHSSALSAAAVCRSAVEHAHLHIISNKPGDFAHTATNISYDI